MKSASDLFNETIPLGRLTQMVNQERDRLLNDYLSPIDITATQLHVLCSIHCEVRIAPVELKVVPSVDPGAMMRMFDRPAYRGWIKRLPNPADKRGALVQSTPDGAALYEQCHRVVSQKLRWELTESLLADEAVALK